MRTRFLTTDFFASPLPMETLRRFEFCPLSPPNLPSPDPPPDDFEIDFSGIGSSFDLPLEIDSLPIETGLSQFLSDVVPRLLPAGDRDLVPATFLKPGLVSGAKGIDDLEKSEAEVADEDCENWWSLTSGYDNSDEISELIHEKEVEKLLHSNLHPSTAEPPLEGLLKELLFEVVEVEPRLIEFVNSFKDEEGGIHLEIPDIKIIVEPMDIEVGVTISHPDKVVKFICSVENVCAIFDDGQEYSSAKDGCCSSDGATNAMVLPQFEVNENNLENDAGLSGTEAFISLIPVIECCDEARIHDMVVNTMELPASVSIDLLEHFPVDDLAQQSPEKQTLSLDTVLEMDHISLADNMLLERGSKVYPITVDGVCSHLPCSVNLQEVQIFCFPSNDVLQSFVNSEAANMLGTFDTMFTEDMYLGRNLYESILSSELTLVDDIFQSLPTPIFSGDDKAIKSVSMAFGEVLCALKPHPLSACDGIYLDWHPLFEGPCGREICSAYTCMLEQVSCCDTSSEIQIEENVTFSIDFYDNSRESKGILPSKLLPTEFLSGISQELCPSAKHESSQLKVESRIWSKEKKDDTRKAENGEQMPNTVSEKSSLLFESMSQCNDLNFFLDARRGKSSGNCEYQTIKTADKQIRPSFVPSQGPSAPCMEPNLKSTRWAIDVHKVSLSENILGLMEHINHSYLAILKESTDLTKNNLAPMACDSELLRLPKQKLLELISRICTSQRTEGSEDNGVMDLAALYAVKQLGYILYSFGFHTARQYISHLTRGVAKVAEKLRTLAALVEDVCQKSDKQIIESHPSLSHIEKILTSNIGIDEKILIVADRSFWLPLTRKLSSMRITFSILKISDSPESNLDVVDSTKYEKSTSDCRLHFHCSLTSYENVSGSFPFKNFSTILEYGGPNASSRISSMLSNLDYLPKLHFIHVDMGSVALPITLSEDLNASRLTESITGNLKNHHIIEILSFVPTVEKRSCSFSEFANKRDSSHDNEPMSIRCSTEVMNADSRISPFPDSVIIVNTKSFEKKMLISRRTSYQKILAMEKTGVQVVERDIGLPLDLVFSAAVCLIWYEFSNFGGNKATKLGSSDITIFVENIATDILMSLSFSFNCCILIFEGESSFLATIMESSDALYAAAASLDMNLQLFFSHVPESTDDIILSSIQNATKSSRSLYPAMPESESLGESFLLTFPSINPLSAHAILSCGGTLVEFLEWSNEQRIRAIGKYQITDESISLFSSLCRYGELGESKSVMTDCSSVDSEIHSELLPSPMKRPRHACQVLPELDIDPLFAEAHDQTIQMNKEPRAFQPYQLRNFSNIHERLKNLENNSYEDVLLKRRRVTLRKQKGNARVVHDYLNEDFRGEVENDGYMLLGENISPESDSFMFHMMPESKTEPAIATFHSTSQEPRSTKSYTMFPVSGEINHGTSKWSILKDLHQVPKAGTFKQTPMCSRKDDALAKHGEYIQETSMQDRKTKILHSLAHGKKPLVQGEKALSNAARISRLQEGPQGPHWTTEFMYGPNEKSSTSQQNYPRNTCMNRTRISNNKDTKIHSPSTIDSYRYKGNSKVKNTAKQKWEKGGKEQLCKKARKEASFILRTWTPIDKRARQDLSFTRDGKEKQSKLVWRNRNSPLPGCSIRKPYRDEG